MGANDRAPPPHTHTLSEAEGMKAGSGARSEAVSAVNADLQNERFIAADRVLTAAHWIGGCPPLRLSLNYFYGRGAEHNHEKPLFS